MPYVAVLICSAISALVESAVRRVEHLYENLAGDDTNAMDQIPCKARDSHH